MYTLMCKDLDLAHCAYIAKGQTENEVIAMMLEHLMKAHPEKVKTFLTTMSREEVSEMLRQNIRREI